ncbi:MAG: GntR family transcriptional regulator [Firmicutes bacterium]|nr:GntR family transcriptional regulator [Bacillota bacterium]
MGKIKSVREQVYEHVVHMIRTNELDYGDKINIAELQEQLGVSRPPINEALIQLSADGILDNVPRKGFFVKQMTDQQAHEIFEIISALDIYILKKVMMTAAEKDIDALRIIVGRIDAAIEKKDFDDYQELQDHFHHTYLEMCGNPILVSLMDDLRRQVIRTTVFSDNTESLFDYFREANRDHEEIIERIEKKNAEGLTKLIMDHNYRKLNI